VLRLYIDEDAMSDALVAGLRARGIDVVTVASERMRGRPDSEQLAFATRGERSIYSFNIRDYRPLHAAIVAAEGRHSGIIVVQKRLLGVGEQLRRLERLCATRSAGEMLNRLEFLNDWGEERAP
jgi:hypothetical protein